MRKWTLFLSLYFCFCLLAGCTGTRDEVPPQPLEPSAPVTITCRVITNQEGQLLLAGYQVDPNIYCLTSESATEVLPGTLINVTFANGTLLETWPVQFGSISAIEPLEYGFDDRCALYLQVLEDLWAADSGLNGGVEVIGVDLSQTSLNPAERSAVAWAFAGSHGAELLEEPLESLMEQGVITAHPLTASGSGADLAEPKHYFYEWETGIHFSITEQEMEGTYSLTPATFDARKWRSSLGAYFFCDCTALQNAAGQWSEYHIGAEMIS